MIEPLIDSFIQNKEIDILNCLSFVNKQYRTLICSKYLGIYIIDNEYRYHELKHLNVDFNFDMRPNMKHLNYKNIVILNNRYGGFSLYDILSLPKLEKVKLYSFDKISYTLISNYKIKNLSLSVNIDKLKAIYCIYSCKNIETLNLSYIDIDHLSYIESLTRLQIEQSYEKININELTNLTNLSINYIRLCHIDTSNLYKLTTLKLKGLATINIEYHQSLLHLNISKSLISYNLGSLLSLKTLILNKYEHVSDLSNMNNLTYLSLSGNCKVTNIDHLTNLTYLNINNNKHIKNISTLVGLKTLLLCNNKTITSLNTFTNLTYLRMNNINCINDISSLVNLTSLYIQPNMSITNLNTLTKLKVLHLYKNRTINNIEKLVNLTELGLYNDKSLYYISHDLIVLNKLTIINSVFHSIYDLTSLSSLSIYNNKSLYHLNTLVNLTYLSLEDTVIKDISRLERLSYLKTKDMLLSNIPLKNLRKLKIPIIYNDYYKAITQRNPKIDITYY